MEREQERNHELVLHLAKTISAGPDRGIETEQSRYYLKIKKNFDDL
jgi:hypothetical protein